MQRVLVILTILSISYSCGGDGPGSSTSTLTREQQIDAWATELAKKVLEEYPASCADLAKYGPALLIQYQDSWLEQVPEADRDAVTDNLHEQLGKLCESASPST